MSLILAGGLVLGGCGTTASTTSPGALPAAFPNHSVKQIQDQVAQAGDTVQSFTAQARITVRTPNRNRSFNAEVRQRRADSLYMRFSLFGIEGGRLLLTRDSVFFYDTRKKILRTGPLTAAQQLFPAPVTSRQLFANMLGFVAPTSSVEWRVTADSAQYYLSADREQTRVTVDPTRWRVVRYVRRDADSTVVEKRLFTDFRTVEGVAVPHRVLFRRPADDMMAQIRYREVDLNPSGLTFKLGVPPAVPQRPFQ